MKTHEFKLGDKVRIFKKVNKSPWIHTMDRKVGQIGAVIEITQAGNIKVTTNLDIFKVFSSTYPPESLQPAQQVTRKELKDIINRTPQRSFITVEFIKKDGSLRKLTGIRGPTKYLKGKPGENKPTVDTDKHFLFCEMRKGYKAVAKDRLMSVSVGGVYYFTEEAVGEL
jgi:hypothetical protein